VSHLHLPDGLLPPWLWAPALLAVVVVLALTGRAGAPRRVAYQGAMGAMMLAAMAIPLGPLEYHLSLAGPVGVLLGPAGAFQVVFVASTILAFLGHGGLTAVGLNTLVLASAATTAHATFGVLGARIQPPLALALASVLGHAVSGAAWLAVVALALRAPQRPPSLVSAAAHPELLTAAALALWLVGAAFEALVAAGLGRFLARVHPALLPAAGPPRARGEAA
jgi:cobalt/nickel transport system permease protein